MDLVLDKDLGRVSGRQDVARRSGLARNVRLTGVMRGWEGVPRNCLASRAYLVAHGAAARSDDFKR